MLSVSSCVCVSVLGAKSPDWCARVQGNTTWSHGSIELHEKIKSNGGEDKNEATSVQDEENAVRTSFSHQNRHFFSLSSSPSRSLEPFSRNKKSRRHTKRETRNPMVCVCCTIRYIFMVQIAAAAAATRRNVKRDY